MHPLLEALLAAADGAGSRRSTVESRCSTRWRAIITVSSSSRVTRVVLTDPGRSELMRSWCRWVRRMRRTPTSCAGWPGPDGWIGSHDVVLAARGTGGGRLRESSDHETHPTRRAVSGTPARCSRVRERCWCRHARSWARRSTGTVGGALRPDAVRRSRQATHHRGARTGRAGERSCSRRSPLATRRRCGPF